MVSIYSGFAFINTPFFVAWGGPTKKEGAALHSMGGTIRIFSRSKIQRSPPIEWRADSPYHLATIPLEWDRGKAIGSSGACPIAGGPLGFPHDRKSSAPQRIGQAPVRRIPFGCPGYAWSTKRDRLSRACGIGGGPLGFPHDRKSSVPTLSRRLELPVSPLGVQAAPG